nr:MAG TPA: tail protein [Caudoviricetes sp.]
MIEIKDISGKTRLSIPINKGAKGKFTLMKEDYIILPFSVAKPVQFKLGDYVDLSGVLDESLGGKLAKIYEITDLQKPTYNTSTGGYDYNLQMNAYYWKWKNKIFKYTPEHAGNEASWSLTAALDVQLGVFLRNLKALGYTYRGTDFIFSIDDTVENKAVAMTYDNMNLLDALFSMAGEDKWNCDCWITDNVIHFGRNEFGDAVKIERGVEASSITRSESQGTYATRIYAFGSTKNIPTNYRPTDEQAVVNGVVQKRLMLPADTPYIDAYEGMSQEEAIEDVVVFDDVYPRRVGTLSDVHTRTEEVENEDGTKETITYYRYKDAGLEFKEDYILEGEKLKIQFQSGKLNGMEFGVIFNPKPKDESRGDQLWEIVRNEDYGRPLPDDMMYPANGDEYILSGFDIQLVSDQYIPEAEQELKEKAQKYTEKVKKDDGTYPTTLRSSWVKEDLLSRTFEFGQRINLVDDTYFENGRISRVLGWEMNLDIPWDSPVYTIGESMPYSRIGEIEDKVDSLTYKGQTYNGNGNGVYVIRVNDSTTPSDSNVFSALKSLKTLLRKDQPDGTSFPLKFGDFIDSIIAGKGAGIYPDGRGQFEKLEVRSAMIVKELIYNRWFAQEGNVTYSESGTIERIEQLEDGTYDLYLRRRWDNDITAFKEQDVDYGSVNNLNSTGEYYDSWFRVLNVMQAENKINVVLYPDEEVPGGKNYPPVSGMVITRRGNAVDEERQGFWYISSYEGCICMLDGVTKPVLEESNYSIIIGKLKRLELFDNLPINYRQSYVYCRGIAIQDLMRIDYQGVVVVQLNDRGFWSLDVAQSENPYTAGKETVDTVWHFGCRWKCLVTGTTDEPRYASTGWAMIEGNPAFTIDLDSSNGWQFDADRISDRDESGDYIVFTELIVSGLLYNQDVTDNILDSDVTWTRDTGNVSEDNAWAIKRASAGKRLGLTLDDLGTDYMTRSSCSFKATVLLRDGQKYEIAENYVTF